MDKCLQWAQDAKEQIAVLDFDVIGSSKEQGAVLSNQLRAELLKTGRFTVVNRAQLDKILDELALQQQLCTQKECAVQVGKLLGVPMGCDICYTNHAEADQDDMDVLLTLLGVAGCNYIMGVPGGDDIMLGYQSTSMHDALYLRQLLGLRPAPEFAIESSSERWRRRRLSRSTMIGGSTPSAIVGLAASRTGAEKVICVAAFAPVRHTSPYGSSPPTSLRPRACGRP